jgi:hypothetical protein
MRSKGTRSALRDLAQSSGKIIEVTIGLGRSGTVPDCAKADPILLPLIIASL